MGLSFFVAFSAEISLLCFGTAVLEHAPGPVLLDKHYSHAHWRTQTSKQFPLKRLLAL